MGLIAALLPTPIQLARLRSAVGRRYSVVACSDWHDLSRTCAREAVGMAVVDLYAEGREGFRDLRQLRRQHPSISVVLYVSLPPCRPHDLFEAGRFGLDGLAIVDEDDGPPALLAVIEQAEARGITQAVRAALTGVRPTARDAALLTVTRAHQRLTPQQLASILGIRRRALAARLEAAGFPPPSSSSPGDGSSWPRSCSRTPTAAPTRLPRRSTFPRGARSATAAGATSAGARSRSAATAARAA